jgi:phage head maturation protease
LTITTNLLVMKRLFKKVERKVEDVDDKKGVVAIVINAFGKVDADGDISAPRSFNKTVKENIHRIKHFLNHDSWLLLGLPKEFKIDQEKIVAISQLNMSKQLTRDVFEDYKFFAENNRTLEHSIGFEVIKRDKEDRRVILEYRLWEYSTLYSWGANEHTPMVYLKESGNLAQRIDTLERMLKMNYSPDRMRKIEKAIESLTDGAVSFGAPTVTEPAKAFAKIAQALDSLSGDTPSQVGR